MRPHCDHSSMPGKLRTRVLSALCRVTLVSTLCLLMMPGCALLDAINLANALANAVNGQSDPSRRLTAALQVIADQDDGQALETVLDQYADLSGSDINFTEEQAEALIELAQELLATVNAGEDPLTNEELLDLLACLINVVRTQFQADFPPGATPTAQEVADWALANKTELINDALSSCNLTLTELQVLAITNLMVLIEVVLPQGL